MFSRIKRIWHTITYPAGFLALIHKVNFVWRISGLRGLLNSSWRYIQKRWQIYAGLMEAETQSFVRLQIETILSTLAPVQDGFIFISHDASATGAPITLLNQCKAYKQVFGDNLVIVLISGGELVKDFQAVAPVLDLFRATTTIVIDEDVDYAFAKLRRLGYSRCIANTVISGSLTDTLKRNHIETVYEIHELLQVIRNGGWVSYANNIAQSGSVVIFPAHYVADKFIQHFGLPAERTRIIPQGISLVYKEGKSLAREKLLGRLGLPNLPGIKIALGAGLAHHRKGTDLFCEVAAEFHKGQRNNVHFIWLGNRDDHFERWKNRTLPGLPYKKNIHFWDFDPQPAYIFAGADVFLLTSREDPFPSVAIESLANDTPVITFKNTGGIEEILDETNGIVVEHLNVHAMAEATWKILQNLELMQPSATNLQTYPEFIKTVISLFSVQEQAGRSGETGIIA